MYDVSGSVAKMVRLTLFNNRLHIRLALSTALNLQQGPPICLGSSGIAAGLRSDSVASLLFGCVSQLCESRKDSLVAVSN